MARRLPEGKALRGVSGLALPKTQTARQTAPEAQPEAKEVVAVG